MYLKGEIKMKKENFVIVNAINEATESGHNVWIGTDFHACKYDKETGLVYISPKFDAIIKEINDKVSDDDVFIFLGDLLDSEITDTRILHKVCKTIKGKTKIFIRGNNDTFGDSVYLAEGFNNVCFGILYENIYFSHTSIDISNCCEFHGIYNVHGHIHRDYTDVNSIPYYHECRRNINVCGMNGNIVNLNDIKNNLKTLSRLNTKYIEGKTEKPGMSQFVQNQATDLLYELLNIKQNYY